MTNRREFVKRAVRATAGLAIADAAWAAGSGRAQEAPARREIRIGGRRIRVVDIHAHCVVPEVMDVIRGTPLALTIKDTLDARPRQLRPERIQAMDVQGVDVEVLSINVFWHETTREHAGELIRIQNERMAQWCAAHPDRFLALASVALQYPDLAVEQLEHAVSKLGMRGVAIAGSVGPEELSLPKFDAFWSKAEALGTLVFMHPEPAPGTTQNARLAGKGTLNNVIGNPLETTVFLSHLIFEGTLDRHPGLRICASHGGGYLASYSGRSDALCHRSTGIDCRNLRKRPSDYFKHELFADTIVFDEDSLRHLVTASGVSQILYGTDFPFDWPVGVDFVLNAPFLGAADKEAILGGNAARLLRLA